MSRDNGFEERSKKIFDDLKAALKQTLGEVYDKLDIEELNYTWTARFKDPELNISIEADAHWINLETGFGVIDEYSVGKRSNVERVINETAVQVYNLLKYGCTRVEAYKSGQLIFTDYYCNGRAIGARRVKKVKLFGKKSEKKDIFSYES